MKKTRAKISETKSGISEEINEIDKPLARLIKTKKKGLKMKDPYKHRNSQYCRNSTVEAYRKDRLLNK